MQRALIKSKTYYILVKPGHAEYSMKHANGFYALFLLDK